MPKVNRRSVLRNGAAAIAIPVAAMLSPGCTQSPLADKGEFVKIHYLEIVTPDVEGVCSLYSMMYGTTFGDPDQALGGARTADLDGGGMLGVRGPLRDTEAPVVRPYVLVDDISAAVSAAAAAGAEIAVMPTEIGGYGQFAIVVHGGIESGLWQI